MVRALYLPAPPVGIMTDELRRMKDETKGTENPGLDLRSSFSLHPPSFACSICHGIRGFSTIAPNSWNDLVSYFSGGLLYGHEVPEPADYRQSARRKHAYRPRIRQSPRRQQLLELILKGRTAAQIAAEMGLALRDVYTRICLLRQQKEVRERIAAALREGATPLLRRDERTRRRRSQVLELLQRGLAPGQIAQRLGIEPRYVWQDTYLLCREHGVKGRKQLMETHHRMYER